MAVHAGHALHELPGGLTRVSSENEVARTWSTQSERDPLHDEAVTGEEGRHH